MPNNFNNNTNKKDLQGSSIKYTTWRLNYQNDTAMEQSGGMIPSGESSNLEDNKTAIIDVSTYIEPIEINPSDDYDGMKKTTVILNNLNKGFKMLPIRTSCPSNSSSNNRFAFIGAENNIFTKNSYTVEEGMDLLQYTYILYNDSTTTYYYKTLLEYVRQKINNDWTIDSVNVNSTSSYVDIKFYGTEDKSLTNTFTLSIFKNNGILPESFDFSQWSDYGAE